MIALFSALLGFISSAVPEFLRLFRDGRDRAHEITLLKLQIEHERSVKQGEQLVKLEAVALESYAAEQLALNARLKEQLTGIHWVDALAGSVRPVITYAFFLLYFLIKCGQFHLLLSPQLPWLTPMSTSQALVGLWTEEDVAIFSAIMAFWFGHRMLQKARIR